MSNKQISSAEEIILASIFIGLEVITKVAFRRGEEISSEIAVSR